jgi:hypothetical protein
MSAKGVTQRFGPRPPGEAPTITPAMLKAGSDVVRRDRHGSNRPSEIAVAVYRAMDAERRRENQ